MLLNFGHTLAHALEAMHGYRNLLHGEAVAIGMVFAALRSEGIGVAPAGTALRRATCASGSACPRSARPAEKAYLSALRVDKKRGSTIEFVALKGSDEQAPVSLRPEEILPSGWRAGRHGIGRGSGGPMELGRSAVFDGNGLARIATAERDRRAGGRRWRSPRSARRAGGRRGRARGPTARARGKRGARLLEEGLDVRALEAGACSRHSWTGSTPPTRLERDARRPTGAARRPERRCASRRL